MIPETPRQVAAIIHKTYPAYGGIGGLIARARPFICPFEEVLRRLPKSETMLDVGCGVGSFSVVACDSNLVRHAHSIDVSKRSIDSAKRHAKPRQGNITFETVPPGVWPGQEYDSVVSIDVIHHVRPADQRDYIAGLLAAAKPGGVVLIKDIAPEPRWKAAANTLHDALVSNQWVSYPPEETVAQWIVGAGARITEHIRLDRLWYPHYLISVRKS